MFETSRHRESQRWVAEKDNGGDSVARILVEQIESFADDHGPLAIPWEMYKHQQQSEQNDRHAAVPISNYYVLTYHTEQSSC